MLCGKCHENIPQGKEMQIEGTIICKKCVLADEKTNKEKVVARCWNCNKFIYKEELVHEFTRNGSKNFSKWFSIRSGSTEKLFQCDECYQMWRKNAKKAQNLSSIRFLLLGICAGYFLGLVLKLFFPEIYKRFDENTSSIITFLVILFIVAIIIEPILNVDRYKISVKKKK